VTPEARAIIGQSCGLSAVIVENADGLIAHASALLDSLGLSVLPLPQLERGVTRRLITGVPVDLERGLCELTDALADVVEAWRADEFDWFTDERIPKGRRTLIMGVLNVTPDSFSDGGRFAEKPAAVDHALRMAAEGADLIDVGGCSTRPGAETPGVEEEIRRVVPVIEGVRAKSRVPVSIDTFRAQVARRALDAGADVINDVTALTNPGTAGLAASRGVPVVLMHMKGDPRTMQEAPRYDDLLGEITRFLRRAAARAVEAGVRRERIALDPGIGFGKTVEHNLEILRRLDEFRSLGAPLLVGTSRKSVIGKVLDRPVDERMMGTAATVALAVAAGAAIVRVHDVAAMRDVVRMTEAVLK
jgi:dihydropteroate synthase